MTATAYTTRGGEQWDEIAKAVYGDEKYADYLMANNLPLLEVYEFDAGAVLQTPELPAVKAETLPEWRQQT